MTYEELHEMHKRRNSALLNRLDAEGLSGLVCGIGARPAAPGQTTLGIFWVEDWEPLIVTGPDKRGRAWDMAFAEICKRHAWRR